MSGLPAMSLRLADRSREIAPSATMAMAAEAKRLKSEGIDVRDFSIGEPDFDTPAHILEAADQAMRSGKTHYTPAPGIPELRRAVAESYGKRYRLEVAPAQVVVSNGAKHGIHNALMALCGPGDEVIIPAPYWVSYADLVRLAGAKPVIVPTTLEEGFVLRPDVFRQAVTKRTRLVMINSPCNPTGAVYRRDQLEALADAALETDVGILSDEIYEDLVYQDAESTCFATLRPELPERTVTISGVSKSYAMTGWRIGWAVAPEPVSKFMSALQSQETGNPCSVSQWAALAALNGPKDDLERMRNAFEQRRAAVQQRIEALPEVGYLPPQGAFYAFLDVSRHFGRSLGGRPVEDSKGFCEAALSAAHVALVPGSAFGAEGFVRLSFATDLTTLERGFDALERFLRS